MSKNPKLAYEANEPAFLQKLRGQYGDQSGRLERPSARPRKTKDDKDDDDAPVYVDEASNEVISKEEYQTLVQQGMSSQKEDDVKDPSTALGDGKKPPQSEPTAKQSNLTEVGGRRKRKQVQVVDEDNKSENTGLQEAQEGEKEPPKVFGSRKPKKAKKIKLSFDEE